MSLDLARCPLEGRVTPGLEAASSVIYGGLTSGKAFTFQSDFPRLEERLAAALLALNFQEGQTVSRWETIFKA